ncbi:hypothetical protein AD949_10350 [Acetobacter orleanensis]|nr:hypothetical protein AD949_10350 [Acetobacter orleanensis]PCD80051.1 hypothetical protein CO710_04140 [Acetobacter orleanensis]
MAFLRSGLGLIRTALTQDIDQFTLQTIRRANNPYMVEIVRAEMWGGGVMWTLVGVLKDDHP